MSDLATLAREIEQARDLTKRNDEQARQIAALSEELRVAKQQLAELYKSADQIRQRHELRGRQEILTAEQITFLFTQRVRIDTEKRFDGGWSMAVTPRGKRPMRFSERDPEAGCFNLFFDSMAEVYAKHDQFAGVEAERKKKAAIRRKKKSEQDRAQRERQRDRAKDEGEDAQAEGAEGPDESND